MDFVEDILLPSREGVDDDLNEFFDEVMEKTKSGEPIESSVDLVTDEVVEVENKVPEVEMIEEIRRFTIPTRYDDAEDGDGPKRLRPTTVPMAAEAVLDFNLGQRAKSLSPFHSKWDNILENPSKHENPAKAYSESLSTLRLSVELLHNFTLIHDDINDGDKTRRTVDTTWENERQKAQDLNWPGDETKKGIDHGILDGDLLRTFAYTAIADTDFTERKKNRMDQVLREAERNILYGQNRDLWMEGLEVKESFKDNRGDIDEFLMGDYDNAEDLYNDMIDKKTVDLYVASVEIGAIAADATDKQREHLKRYARNVGIPFQVRDDVLEIENASSLSDVSTGKDPTDIVKGKTTSVANSAYQNVLNQLGEVEQDISQKEHHDPALEARREELEYHKNALEEMYDGDENLTEEEITEVADIIYEHENVSDMYERKLEKAEEHLQKADLNGDIEPFLEFGRYLKDREY